VGKTRLAEEMAAINLVHAALASRDATAALKRIDEYERGYPTGLLAVEAEVLRIDALSLLGNRGEVEWRSRRFLGEQPDSPYARRVRSVLEGKAATP